MVYSHIVKTFDDGSFVKYTRGNFDDWCVMLRNSNYERICPKDIDYFSFLKKWAKHFGEEQIYNDFVTIYNHTNNTIDERVLSLITSLSKFYGNQATKFDKVFTIIYMGMVAEENKDNTHLGKRVKRLGMYKLLMQNKNAKVSSCCMCGKNWKEIDKMCCAYGF